MKNAILFTATTYGSMADKYGNCYYYSVITASQTGKSVTVHSGAENNTRARMYDACTEVMGKGDMWPYLQHHVVYLPIREYNRQEKVANVEYVGDADIVTRIVALSAE
jgi:hypothetical protein